VTATGAAGLMLPYVQKVMNNATALRLLQFKPPIPPCSRAGIQFPFSITRATWVGGAPTACPAAGAFNGPVNVRDVEVTLIVQATGTDAQTGRPRVVELHGRGAGSILINRAQSISDRCRWLESLTSR